MHARLREREELERRAESDMRDKQDARMAEMAQILEKLRGDLAHMTAKTSDAIKVPHRSVHLNGCADSNRCIRGNG